MSDVPFPSPPPSPSADTASPHRPRLPVNAASLPVDVLTVIFSYAIDVPAGVRPHGGYLESWQSNETMRAMALVCRGWVEAATNVLYGSVALPSRRPADLLLRTLRDSPFLADKVHALSLSVGDETFGASTTLSGSTSSSTSSTSPRPPPPAGDSFALLEVLEACRKTIVKLHVHSLHLEARQRLFEVLNGVEKLEAFMCSPRFHGAGGGGGHPQPFSIDGVDGTSLASIRDLSDGGSAPLPPPTTVHLSLPPTLHSLELDFESSWSAAILPLHAGMRKPSALRRLRLRCDMDEDVLLREVLARSTGLEVCELYFERLVARDEAAAALRASTGRIKHMLFITNPTIDNLVQFDTSATPIFDRLLPFYTNLETLAVSSTEVSSSVIRLAPPSLIALEIQAFNHRSTFVFTPQLAADLRDPTLATGLRSLRVHDAAEAWEEADIEALRAACEERGIDFHFKLDTDGGSHGHD